MDLITDDSANAQSTLPERIEAARQSEYQPRAVVMRLAASYTAAVAAADHVEAARLQPELQSARERLAVAEATTKALSEAHAALTADQAAREQDALSHQQRAQAQAALTAAGAAERDGLEAVDEALTAMRNALASAQRFFRAAQVAEQAVNEARHRQITARGRLGEWAADHPGPTPARANKTRVLSERDPMVAQLARWSPTT